MSARLLSTIALTFACATSAAIAGDVPVQAVSFKGETYLSDTAKMTLYTFSKDGKNKSNCYDACATNWPPLLTEAAADLPKGYKAIERKDGTLQVAYKGKPLYLWIKDAKPGDMTGDGVKGVWFVARP